MSKQWILGIAFVLLLASLPLISLGTTRENDTLWWAGLALLVAGALIAPVSRYLMPEEEDAEGEEDGNGDGNEERREHTEETEPAEIRVEREGEDDPSREDARSPSPEGSTDASSADRDSAPAPLGEHERRARAHEQRAEAHRERAAAHEELAEAEEERARGEADADGEESSDEGKDAR